jgi:hypothetical protein
VRQFRYFSAGRAVLALASLLLSGCSGEKLNIVSETDEKQFQYGEQMIREDRFDDALTAFQNVIVERQDNAPESHLEIGRVLVQTKKDPYAAIYHFQKYVAAKPDSEQAPMVRELIETEQKEIARSLPGQPYQADYDRLDLLDQIKSLQAENNNLRQQLGMAEKLNPDGAAPQNPASAPPAAPAPATVAVQPQPPVEETPPAPAPNTPAANPTVATTPASAARSYTVESGDTLSAISLKMYGTRTRYMEIYNANRDQLAKPDSTLHIGEVLKIP